MRIITVMGMIAAVTTSCLHAQSVDPRLLSTYSEGPRFSQLWRQRQIAFPVQADRLTEAVLLSTVWTLGGSESNDLLLFYSNDVFRFGSVQAGPAIQGTYKLESDGSLVLKTRTTISQWGRSIRPFENAVMTFRFRNDIQNLWYKAGLTETKTGVTFYAEGSEWPSGGRTTIGGVEVVRMNEKVVVTDHLRFRNRPSTSGRVLKVSYPCCGPSPVTEYGFFLKGTVLGAMAHTTEEDNVQGRMAYWYYVEWEPFETPVFGWVYGAYLAQFEKSKEGQYDKMWSDDQASVSGK